MFGLSRSWWILVSDAHEWINEIPTVPTYYLESSETTAKGMGLG